jgi:phage I-like protein
LPWHLPSDSKTATNCQPVCLLCHGARSRPIKDPSYVNATTARELPANQARRKRDRVALDFQHNTVDGSQFYKGEPAKIAAFASLEIVEGEGIYLSNIEWTPDGKAFAADGHYPDLSPAIITNDKGEVMLVYSAGLARQGEIEGITLFSAPAFEAVIRTLSPTPEGKRYLIARFNSGETGHSIFQRISTPQGLSLLDDATAEAQQATLKLLASADIASAVTTDLERRLASFST